MLLRDPQGHPLSWASNTHRLPLRLPWPRVFPDWLQPENTEVGVACANWRLGGRSWWEHQELGGGGTEGLLFVGVPPICPSISSFMGPLLQSLKQTSSRRGNQGSERTAAFPRPQAGRREPACFALYRALWVGPQPVALGAPQVGRVLAGPAESRGGLGVTESGVSGSF